MSSPGRGKSRAASHPYLAGNFAPVTETWSPTPVTWTGEVPVELLGGMYVRNGGNPATNSDLGREAHWFDGDGMLSGVWFERSSTDPLHVVPHFVNQYILTDVYLSSIENNALRTPILPSIATLVNPLSTLFFIVWRIMRTVLIVILSHCPGSQTAIKRISVANTSILFHDGRALATCESGPPMRVTLPELETVGWFNGSMAEGEPCQEKGTGSKDVPPTLGGTGPLSWMREWTTGHPKVDQTSGELVLFHCSFAPPYVQYSLLPSRDDTAAYSPPHKEIMNAAVPGCTGGKLMHDFGVSKHHTVILDLPLSLTPTNLLKNNPVVLYEPKKPSRFGVFPRYEPASVRWFETTGCCIFHTANTWDEYNHEGQVTAVNLLACRLTSASLVFSAGNIVPPPHPDRADVVKSRPMSFFAKYDDHLDLEDPEKSIMDENTPLLPARTSASSSRAHPPVPISYDDQEQCRLYYYRFAMNSKTSNEITHQFALSAIPFEFPTVSPVIDMMNARYIYGCSTTNESFGAALGKATKIDLIIKMDVRDLLARAHRSPPDQTTGCVDDRTIDQILASTDRRDPIKAFKLPPHHYGQEPRFVPRGSINSTHSDSENFEDEGYLIFYVFNEDQLDNMGQCGANAKSELWVLDAKTMENVVCKIELPTRVPYGLHGNWFSESHIMRQRKVQALRAVPELRHTTKWSRTRSALFRSLG
ncbi:carotenoid oxygenase [Ophiobolus disseminans]|uniref:Carotenoid oxygenase n=1 Tax=Ophiobolus disseminans TaxID=1469910 RepID=A0A6A6ZFZ5_9PLEO|nr:carotenoid oxygenase [Ophiobolus disseminans]